jgi:hypothetical protein
MKKQETEILITRIVELETEITSSIIKGHKPYHGDCFDEKRKELSILRCVVFGYESEFCKIKKGSHGTP